MLQSLRLKWLLFRLQANDPNAREMAANTLGHLGNSRAVEPLIVTLDDNSDTVRSAAAVALGHLGDACAIEPLIEILDDESAFVRLAAIAALEELADLRAVAALGVVLKDRNEQVRRVAVEAMRQLGGSNAAKLLHIALEDSSETVRRLAVEALHELGTSSDAEPLIAALKDPSDRVRAIAANALGKLEDGRAIDPLMSALEDSSFSVRAAAAEALRRLGHATRVAEHERAQAVKHINSLIGMLSNGGCDERKTAARKLATLRAKHAVGPLTEMLKDKDVDIRLEAVRALCQLGALEPLVQALRDSDRRMQEAAVNALKQLGWKLADAVSRVLNAIYLDRIDDIVREGADAAVDPLIGALGASDRDVRRVAARALERMNDARAVDALIGAIGSNDDDVRNKAIMKLVSLQDSRAVDLLIRALEATCSNVRTKAAWALGKRGDLRAVDPLIGLLKDNHDVRSAAAVALGQLGDSRAIDPLIVLLKDSDARVRQSAAEALRLLGWQFADSSQRVLDAIKWKDVARCIREGAEVAVDPLTGALHAYEDSVRLMAAEALGQLGDVLAVRPLLDCFNGHRVTSTRSPAEWTAIKKGLINILEKDSARVRGEELYEIAALDDMTWLWKHYINNGCGNSEYSEGTAEIDLSDLRQSARQGLAARKRQRTNPTPTEAPTVPSLEFACPHCQKRIRVEAKHVGRQVACPNCRRQITIPLKTNK